LSEPTIEWGKVSMFFMLYDDLPAGRDFKNLGKSGEFEFDVCLHAECN
jgi:hypothetical protein